MRVFRCITAREITNMYKKNVFESHPPVQGGNTHTYEKKKEYIHFFRYSQDADYHLHQHTYSMSHVDNYVAYMIANIPNEILRKYMEYGYYTYDKEPFKNDLIPLPEYAIPLEEFQREWIVEINTYIQYQYLSDEEEYKRYLAVLDKLFKQPNQDYSTVGKFLKAHDLETTLDVKDDDRTEKQIKDDELNELMKHFPLYD